MNVAKHAHASHAWLDLERSEHEVTLSIRDDGVGFDLTTASQRDERGVGLGLFGMEERAHLVGGSLKIATDSGKSTAILARIPLNRNTPVRDNL
jgi:signal transduction histidine kinase